MKKPDRRTKEWKLSQIEVIVDKPPLGLGDVVEKITEATGIKKVVKAIFGDDCGCEERKEALNKIKLPEKYTAYRCLSEEQYKEYEAYTKRRTLNKYEYPADVEMLTRLFAHVFALQYPLQDLCITCKGSFHILNKIIEPKLDIVFKSYDI